MSDMSLRVDLRLPLDRFELAVAFEARGHVLGVFGPSGCGKTSLLEAIAGLRPEARGLIRLGEAAWLDSANKHHAPPEARAIGYVPQDGLLFPHLDVRGNLLAGARRASAAGLDVVATLAEVAALLELAPLLGRAVDTLSGGERQRVALGRALCSGPQLLLLDEPLAALDLPLRRRILPLLRRVREASDVPMLFVSHDPTEVQALCDETLVLEAGQVIARGAPREVLTNPAVYPIADAEGFDNVLAGRLLDTGAGAGAVGLDGAPEVRLLTRPVTAPAGTAVLVAVAAGDIIVATTAPTGLSARNQIPATLEAIRPVGDRRLALARVAPNVPPVAVELTEAACADLGLRPGREVHLIIKASACAVYGADGA